MQDRVKSSQLEPEDRMTIAGMQQQGCGARLHGQPQTGTQHITQIGSGHEIHQEPPQLVIASIGAIVDAVRMGAMRLLPWVRYAGGTR